MTGKEEIDQLAEAAELLDRAALKRATIGDPVQSAWLMFREAELRMTLSGMRNVRDSVQAQVPFMDQLRQRMKDDGIDL